MELWYATASLKWRTIPVVFFASAISVRSRQCVIIMPRTQLSQGLLAITERILDEVHIMSWKIWSLLLPCATVSIS